MEDTRIALIGIIVEDLSATEKINLILHDCSEFIVGRMGIPYRKKNVSIISVIIDAPADQISAISGKRVMRSPDSFLDFRREALDRISERVYNAWDRGTERRRSKLASLAGRIDALSPLAVLTRGYGAAFGEDGKPITKATALPKGKRFTLKLSDGTVNAVSEGEVKQ